MRIFISNHRCTKTLLVVLWLCTMSLSSIAQEQRWYPVQNANINSHQPGAPWCPPGEFIVALDLDGPRNYSAHDTPVIGQAMCSSPSSNSQWGTLEWVDVGTHSHQPGGPWCKRGMFIVSLDLDGPRNLSAHDSPIVGKAQCASSAGRPMDWSVEPRWVSVERAGINSHQPGPSWCPSGQFLVAIDLDSRSNYSPYDSPVVGQALCARP